MRRVILILITPAVIILLLAGVLKYYAMPRLEVWALTNLKDYSEKNLPVTITAEKLTIYLLKPSLGLEGITIRPKGELADVTPEVNIKGARAYADFFQLLGGRLNLSAVVIDSPSTQINLDPLLKDNSKPEPLPLDDIFAITEKIPVQRVFIQNFYLDVTSEKQKWAVNIRQGNFHITNMGKNLTGKSEIPDLRVSLKGIGDFAGGLDAHLYLTRQSLKVIQLGIRLNDSEMITRGELTDFKNVTLLPQGALTVSAKINLSDLNKEIRRVQPKLRFPALEGTLQTDTELQFKGLENIAGKTQIKTRQVVVDKFHFGDASVQGTFKDATIKLSEFKVNHPAGSATLDESEITVDKNIRFATKLRVNDIDVQKLFVSLDLKDIPVGMQISGTMPCKGQLFEPLQLDCDVKAQAHKLWVRSKLKEPKSEILSLDEFQAEGHIGLDAKGIKYEAKLGILDSHGTSDGVIDFKEGFKINFKTDRLDFKNVHNLANLKFIGAASIEGSTEGDTDAATFTAKLGASNFTFEGFLLGDVGGQMTYKRGHLLFENLSGNLNRTQYLGGIDVDLVHDQIGGQIKLPAVDLSDVTKILENLYKFPVPVSGAGQGEVTFSGPLNFWKMSYQLNSNFKNFLFGPESYDSLIFNVESKAGDIKAQKVVVQKNSSTLSVSGGISSEKVMNLVAESKNWRLEESDVISKINSNIFGVANFAAEIKGPFTAPAVLVRGTVTETVIEEQEVPKSNFLVRIDKNHLESDVSLFGDKIVGEILMPLGDSHSPLRIKMKTNDWAFSTLLSLMGGSTLSNEYDSSLTSSVDLSSESGDLFKATGDINIKNIFLKRANYSFKNPQPINIHMNAGMVSIKNFLLEGPRNSIRIKGDNFSSENLNIAINADTELRLLHMFLPFLEDLGGPLRMSTSITGSIKKPEVLGNLNVENAFVKLKGFPHAFEKLKVDVVFSHTKVIINSIKGFLGGGTITGDGSVLINGPQDIPTTIRAKIDSATLNVPDHVRSSGNAELLFSGKWFPFVLSGTYHISNAFVDKEFTEDGGGIAGVRQSSYLPKVLKQQNFEPILLDLQVIMDKNVVIKNSLMDGTVTGNLQVKGPPQNPVLAGRIDMDKTSKLIFKDKVFEVQTGQIQFNNPNEIDPELYISAQSRVSDYDISLLVQGNSKNPSIRVNSVPPLSYQDIISLLAFGVTGPKLDQSGQTKGQQASASYEIGALVIAAPINKKLQSTLGLNLQYSSSYDSLRNVNVPKVTLSRKVSDRVNASASRAIGEQTGYDVKLQYLINKNISAIGSYEKKDNQSSSIQTNQQDLPSFFGLDLEYKREFK